MVISDFLYKDNGDRKLNLRNRKLVTKSERTACWDGSPSVENRLAGIEGAKDVLG